MESASVALGVTADTAAAAASPAVAEFVAASTTIVMVTSPIPSHPSTTLIRSAVQSLRHCSGELHRCRLLIVCDGYHVIGEGGVSQYKWGRITAEAALAYDGFLSEMRAWEASGGGFTLLALQSHCGFGGAVCVALERSVRTDLVLVVQHDWLFVPPGFDAASAVSAMLAHPERLPFIGAMSLATVEYRERARHRFGVDIDPGIINAHGARFLPLLMLQDKPHLATAAYLRQFVYGGEHASPPGRFPEDALGQKQIAHIRRDGLAGHSHYRTYVLDQGTAVVYHVSGRKAQASADASSVQASPSVPAVVAVSQLPASRPASEGAGFVRGAAWGCASISGLLSPVQVNEAAAPLACRKRFQGRCFACGQKGHSKDYCPLRPQDQPDLGLGRSERHKAAEYG